MKLNKIVLSLVLCATSASLMAQTSRDKVAFNAMREEMNRTKGIQMQGIPSPFYIGFYMEDTQSLNVRSQYGSVVVCKHEPLTSRIGSEMYLGAYQQNNKVDFSGKIPSLITTSDNNALSIKNSMWTLSDHMYKNSIKDYQSKVSLLKQIKLGPGEDRMADMIKIAPVKAESTVGMTPSFDGKKWSDICNKLSAVFLKYPDFVTSSVNYSANTKTYYIINTDGTELKQTYNYMSISATASLQAENGSMLSNSMAIYSIDEGKMPSVEELEKRVAKMADKLAEMKSVKPIQDYYNGPVLFIGSGAFSAVASPLITRFVASKNLSKTGWNFNSIERRGDKKVLDNKITVKNYTNKKDHNGQELIGCYDMDADGIRPLGEMTLVEGGILKGMLLGRYETVITKEPTGSTRMSLTGRDLSKSVMPGTLHISATGTIKEESMKKALLKLAKEEGLDHAYIIESMNAGCPTVYRVDVKTGKQNLVSSVSLPAIDMSMLRRIPAVSKEDQVVNSMIGGVLMSVIAPKAIILNDVEMDIRRDAKQMAPFMLSPLKRN